jgi:hypothetical protein
VDCWVKLHGIPDSSWIPRSWSSPRSTQCGFGSSQRLFASTATNSARLQSVLGCPSVEADPWTPRPNSSMVPSHYFLVSSTCGPIRMSSRTLHYALCGVGASSADREHLLCSGSIGMWRVKVCQWCGESRVAILSLHRSPSELSKRTPPP